LPRHKWLTGERRPPVEEDAMLVLSRKPGEKVVINGDITISVLEVVGCRVKLGIEAPDQVRVLRAELAHWLEPDEAPRAAAPQRNSP
jgi:carbon storage regulator